MLTLNAGDMGLEELLKREWLAVNHIGGYACSTSVSLNTRKYHGLLVAAMAPPVRRMVLLSRVEESVISGTTKRPLACSEYPGTIHPHGHELLRAFSNEPFPRWAYQADGWTIEKSLRLLRGQNTVCLTYTLLGASAPVEIELRPLFALRPIHELSYQWNGRLDADSPGAMHHRIPPTAHTPEVFFAHDGAFERNGCWYMSTIYRRECERGYAGLEDLWMPGIVRWKLTPGRSVHFVCSADPIDLDRAIADADRQIPHADPAAIAGPESDHALDALLRAAEQFLVYPKSGSTSGVPINLHTGFPWSPPSGRNALIAFTGLLLVPRRFAEAMHLLRTLAAADHEGILPSEFPENGSAPKYLGADTSLWFINAVHEYLRYTQDERGVRQMLFDAVVRIVRRYQGGASLGVAIDADGLVSSHAPGIGTSWMDAKVGDWVITPRQGRTVELNALWYNALRIAAVLCQKFDRIVWAAEFTRLAESVRIAFNKRFWNEHAQCCFDVITDRGVDPSIRPNQVFALSLPYPVLALERHTAVLHTIRSLLLTPMGLRTLAEADPGYHGRYAGDVVARDRACHQGTAYPWLLGPTVTAMTRVHGRSAPARREAMKVLEGCLKYLLADGMGQLCELFDGASPHLPGGLIASALSVGEILRAYVEDVLNIVPQAKAGDIKPVHVRPPVEI